MEALQSIYTQNKSAVHLISLVLGFFLLAGFLTSLVQQRSAMTPPFGPTENFNLCLTTKPEKTPALSEGYYIIRGGRNNKYCSDDPAGLICDRDFVQDWERFYVKPLDNNIYAIRGGRGKWARVVPTGVICNADNYGSPDTLFRLLELGHGNQYRIQSIMSQTHPMPCADYGNGLRCDHRDYNSLEIFIVDQVN